MDTDGQLIELVEQFKFIYDKKHIDFKNKLAKENAWQTISEIMHDSVESVSTRWIILRNRYATEKRKEKTKPSGSGAYHTWHLFKKMQFLDEFYNPRRTLGNVFATSASCSGSTICGESSQQSSLWNNEIYIEADDMMENTSSETADSSSLPDIPKSTNVPHTPVTALQEHRENIRTLKGKKSKPNKSFEDTVTKAFSQIGTYLESTEDQEDEDELFARSIGKTLQTIKIKKLKARAKIEILQILEKYVEDIL